jgi:hypothetical protein
MCVIIIMDVCSTIVKLCTIFWHTAISSHHHHTPVSDGSEFGWGNVLHVKSR